MLFSVIIPLYNKAEYIEAALQSVFDQQLGAFQIIVVDDGSTDDGAQRVDAIDDPRLRLIRQSNRGVSAARNHGIREATGDYVAFLDADDRWEPGYLSAIAVLIEQFPECGMYATHFYRFHGNGFRQVDKLQRIAGLGPQRIDRFFEFWSHVSFFCTCSVVIPLKILRDSGICFPEGERLGEDQDVWFRVAERWPIAYLPEPLVGYRVGVPGSSTSSTPESMLPSLLRLQSRYRSGAVPAEHRSAVRRMVGVQRIHVARTLLMRRERRRAIRLLGHPFCLLAPRYLSRVLLAACMPASMGSRLVGLPKDHGALETAGFCKNNGPCARSPSYRAKPRMWIRIRTSVGVSLNRLGAPGAALLHAWRMARRVAQRVRRKVAPAFSPTIRELKGLGIDIDCVHWIDPAAITFCARHEFALQLFKGCVIAGNWDVATKNFEDLDIFIAMKQVCVEGKDWRSTQFYRYVLERVKDGEPLWGCRNGYDIERRLHYVQSLFSSIRDEGYKTRERLRHTPGPCPRQEDDEVAVCIGRNGELLFSDGAHRLATAKLLGIPRVPVQVSVRHPEWIAFRKELLVFAKESGGRLQQPALHTDLQSIPARQDCEAQFRAIRNALRAESGRLLDIGANLGYFCHRFEDEGYACNAAESSPRALYFLRKLRDMAQKKFEIWDEPVIACEKVPTTRFDVVLVLNGLGAAFQEKGSPDAFVAMLQHLHTQELFLQLPTSRGKRAPDVNCEGVDQEDVVFLIQKHTGLEFCELIAEFEESGRLYRLSARESGYRGRLRDDFCGVEARETAPSSAT